MGFYNALRLGDGLRAKVEAPTFCPPPDDTPNRRVTVSGSFIRFLASSTSFWFLPLSTYDARDDPQNSAASLQAPRNEAPFGGHAFTAMRTPERSETTTGLLKRKHQ